MLKKPELDEFRQLLLTLRARIQGDVDQLTDEALDGGASDMKSPTHIAELGTETYEQDFSLRVVENDQETLDEINAALKRIEDGTFGLCEMCTAAEKPKSRAGITKTRLRAIPHARNCIACERKREELSL
jgi:DnaK suppressor protein